MPKKKTFAEKSKGIKAKYYKNRKPGEDKMTDDAFNREMMLLMQEQEAVKAVEENGSEEALALGGEIIRSDVEEGTFRSGGMMNKVIPGAYGKGGKMVIPGAYRMGGKMMPYRGGGKVLPGVYQNGGMMDNMVIPGAYRKGGGIKIDPAKRGTFKAQATRMGMSVQEAADKILSAPKGKYSPAMRKKANFAKNFAKAEGGSLEGTLFRDGGGLPKYQLGGYNPYLSSLRNQIKSYDLGFDSSNFGQNAFATPTAFTTQGFDANITPDVNLTNQTTAFQPAESGVSGIGQFNPTASILGPLANIAGNLISNRILAKGADTQRMNLLNLLDEQESNIDINLGRVDPQRIDLSRDRANILSNRALTESTGRFLARGARSASEAAAIQNQARGAAQRISGQQLSQSLQKEQLTNAQLRAQAAEQNRQIAAQEALMRQQRQRELDAQRFAVESQFGGIDARLGSEFARATGQSLQNYLAENQRIRRDQQYLNTLNPNIGLDYQQNFEQLSPFNRGLARLGVRQVAPQVTVR